MPTLLLTPLLVLSATMTIRAEYRGPRWLVYLCKPLTTTLLVVLALSRATGAERFYVVAIGVGLLCSLAGDIFLMLPTDWFIAGLVSFLLAHLAYGAAFLQVTQQADLLLLAPFLVYGAVMYRVLLPHLGALRVPVLAYMLVIVAMAWRAAAGWADTRTLSALVAAIGAGWFVVSDSLLAVNRFVGRFRAAQAAVLGTYFLAQWLIACSI